MGLVVTELSRTFARCAVSDEATAILDDVCFIQALQAALNKQSSQNRKTPEQIDAAIHCDWGGFEEQVGLGAEGLYPSF